MNVEHRTSNVQHRMKKQTPNTEHSTAISCNLYQIEVYADFISVNHKSQVLKTST